MEITINLDDDLLREATEIHPGKSETAVLELGMRELINTDQRSRASVSLSFTPSCAWSSCCSSLSSCSRNRSNSKVFLALAFSS